MTRYLILVGLLTYSSLGWSFSIPDTMTIEQFVESSKSVVKDRHQENQQMKGVVYPFDIFSQDNTVIFGIRDESYDRIPLPVTKNMYRYMYLKLHLSMCFSGEFETNLKPIFDRGWDVQYVSFNTQSNKSISRHLISKDTCDSWKSISTDEVLDQVLQFLQNTLPLTFKDNTTFVSFFLDEKRLVERWEVNLQSKNQISEIRPNLSEKGVEGMMLLMKTMTRGFLITEVCRGPTYRKFLDDGYIVSKEMFLKDGTEFEFLHFNRERCLSVLSKINENKK